MDKYITIEEEEPKQSIGNAKVSNSDSQPHLN